MSRKNPKFRIRVPFHSNSEPAIITREGFVILQAKATTTEQIDDVSRKNEAALFFFLAVESSLKKPRCIFSSRQAGETGDLLIFNK